MSEKIILKEEDFKEFKTAANKWIQRFGLIGWSVVYEFKEFKDSYAKCCYDIVGRIVTITLNKSWPKEDYSLERIQKSAFHEVCELLLGRLSVIGQYKQSRTDEFEEEIHNIIRILENVFYE